MNTYTCFLFWILAITAMSCAENPEFARTRTAWRAKVIANSMKLPSPPGEGDHVEDLIDQLKYESLAAIRDAGLENAALDSEPWSDSYWPIYQGILANRYADLNFPASTDWKENYDYILKNLGKGRKSNLSPAEKYDLLIGDTQFTLTRQMAEGGKPYYDSSGNVEPWMGICHGWAPAAFMLPRPARSIPVTAADGTTQIEFFPSDIKALASLLWAEGRAPTRFIGGRCNDETPDFDADGRPRNPDCLDTNPGTWHMAVVNQIGHSRRSFVMDATATLEVWNHPVVGYTTQFFNPVTENVVSNFEQGIVKLGDFPQDKYSKSRAASATAVVGVEMEVRYLIETTPSHRATDDASQDRFHTLDLKYDLELDHTGKIVGGEWHSRQHPDFLWVPVKDSKAKTAGDYSLGSSSNLVWNGTDAAPVMWRKAALKSSAYGQPLGKLVEALIELSQ